MSRAPDSGRPSSKSAPSGERDSRSNPIRIMLPRTPAQLLKFDVQPIQRLTNSRINPCDRCPLFSGDYKLRGRGVPPSGNLVEGPDAGTVRAPLPLLEATAAKATFRGNTDRTHGQRSADRGYLRQADAGKAASSCRTPMWPLRLPPAPTRLPPKRPTHLALGVSR